jgi:general secretion pathway protein I
MRLNTSGGYAHHKAAGLTLIEVMVALFIFALTGSAVMKAAGDHINGVGQIEEMTFATWVANNRMTQLHIDPSWPPKNNLTDSQDMAGRTWYWQQKVQKTNDEEMVQVDVRVSLDPEIEYSITSVTSFIAKHSKS